MKSAAARFSALSVARTSVLDKAREASRLTIPGLIPEIGQNEHYSPTQPYQSAGAHGLRSLSARLLATLFPTSVQFFRLELDAFAAAQLQADKNDVDTRLSQVAETTAAMMDDLKVRPALAEVIKQLIAAGNVVAYGTYFGMFEDGKWGFGGWSAGATIYEFWTSKNLDANGLMRRYCDGWNTTTDGNERFYFATNGRSYYRSRSGHQWRNSADQPMMTLENDGVLDVAAHLAVRGSAINLYGGSPTIRFMDSDNRTAHIHVNSNRFYVLRGAGTNDSGWATVPNKGWPLEIDLETNHATFGGSIYLNSEWLRIHGQTGVYWETYGGGWHMSDSSWLRAYGSKGIYTGGQIRGGTVVGESDRRLKANIATITNATQKVEALTGVTFDWKRTGSAGMGFIAQDFEQVIPALVTEDTDGMKGVEYGPVVALVVEALKETNARVAALENGRV